MEHYHKERGAEALRRGDTVTGISLTGRRVTLSWVTWRQRGFTLIELVMTITVMTILTLGIIPLVKVSVKRQKEQQLRDVLRQMRTAIDEFHRDTVASPCNAGSGAITNTGPSPGVGAGGAGGAGAGAAPYIDPRSKVMISDCTIFGVDNPDRYPPELETLVNGVNVIQRSGGGLGQRGNLNVNATDAATSETLATKKKVYLRAIPIDPITAKAEWDLRSCYDAADASSWGGENVFDVRSKSRETALNGEKYSDW